MDFIEAPAQPREQTISELREVSRRLVRDGNVGGNIARFINHSCKPNCYSEVVKHTVWIRAGRNIKKGEELTYDYNTGGEAGIQCRCRPGCKNKI